MSTPILHIIVVGFHHKKGCQLEYCYPPFPRTGNVLPIPWQNLPSLALPDGAHNVDQDLIYFLLPSLEFPNKAVFGISCYRQISSQDLLNKSTDVTRSTVQKSVCILSRIPLFGILTAKLQLITEAYFNERDFAKVEVLSQLYHNLYEMFPEDSIDDEAAIIDISTRTLVSHFKHRLLVLFKLLMLERKVVFYMNPVHKLTEMILALASLFPRLVEEGIFQAAAYCNPSLTEDDPAVTEEEIDLDVINENRVIEKDDEASDGPNTLITNAVFAEVGVEAEETYSSQKLHESIIDIDSYGFPLSIFTKGCLFHPYISISYLDMIRSDNIRAYCIGVTNTLFVQRRDLLDVIVTVTDNGGELDIVNPDLRQSLSLTAADLRFADFILKNVQENSQPTSWEGSDQWVRLQMHAYLLSLMATMHSGLKHCMPDFNESFLEQWKLTNNFRTWTSRSHQSLENAVPGHPFAGSLGVSDVLLRVEHSVGSSEGGRRMASAVANTGKYFSDTSYKVKSSISTWLRGNNGRNSNS